VVEHQVTALGARDIATFQNQAAGCPENIDPKTFDDDVVGWSGERASGRRRVNVVVGTSLRLDGALPVSRPTNVALSK
jgi:hypothetical protein